MSKSAIADLDAPSRRAKSARFNVRACMVRDASLRDAPHHEERSLSRPSDLVRHRAVGQGLCQMQAADLFRAVEIGERTRHAQDAVITARGEPHGMRQLLKPVIV